MHTSLRLQIMLLIFIILPVTVSHSAEFAYENSMGIKFVRIKNGSFIMGSPKTELGRSKNETLHIVNLSKEFYMSITEITQGQWFKVMGYNPSSFNQCGADCPVERVSWDMCQEFIDKLNKIESTNTYRLPTEAEWEYAARAGTRTAFATGDITTDECKEEPALNEAGWYCWNSGELNPVGNLKSHRVSRKKPNKWGLYDMHGNVQEWVLDSCDWRSWYGWTGVITDTYKNKTTDPLSSKGSHRIFRGGSWNMSPKHARSANRSYYKPGAYRNNIGFRIIKTR